MVLLFSNQVINYKRLKLPLQSSCYCIEMPDPFAKIVVDGSGQCHSTEVMKSTLDPKWNQHYDL
jgi:hypothetical protein